MAVLPITSARSSSLSSPHVSIQRRDWRYVQNRFWNGMSVPHTRFRGAHPTKHRLERRPDLPIRVVEQVAKADRKTHLEVKLRVLERLPIGDPAGHEPVAVEEGTIGESMRDEDGRVRVARHPAPEHAQLGQEPLALVGVPGGRAERERDGDAEARGRLPERPERSVDPATRRKAGAVGVLRDEFDHVQAVPTDRLVECSRMTPVGVASRSPLRRPAPSNRGGRGSGGRSRPGSRHRDRAPGRRGSARRPRRRNPSRRCSCPGQGRVVQVRRVDLLGVILAVERPGQPMVGPIHAEVDAVAPVAAGLPGWDRADRRASDGARSRSARPVGDAGHGTPGPRAGGRRASRGRPARRAGQSSRRATSMITSGGSRGSAGQFRELLAEDLPRAVELRVRDGSIR